MAINRIVEPYVKVRENIRKTPVLLNQSGNTNIGGVIVAPTGPRLAYVSGPKDFIEKYTTDGVIPRNADISFINAYYLSFSAGLVLARSMNTEVTNGRYFTWKGEEGTVTKVVFNVSKQATAWGIELNSKYYFHADTDDKSTFLTIVKGSSLDSGVQSAIEAYEESLIYCKNLDDLWTKIKKDGSYSSLDGKWNDDYSVLTLKEDQTSLFENSANNFNLGIKATTEEVKCTYEATSVNFKNSLPLLKKQTLSLMGNKSTNLPEDCALVLGSTAYVKGSIDRVTYAKYPIQLFETIDELAGLLDGLSGVSAKADGKSNIELEFSEGNSMTLNKDMIEGFTGTKLSAIEDIYTEEGKKYEDMLFAVYPNDPQASDKYQISLAPSSGSIMKLTLKGVGKDKSFLVSLDPECIDPSGNNCYLENLNNMDLGFTFLLNPDPFQIKAISEAGVTKYRDITTQVSSTIAFGESGLNLVASKSVNNLIKALSVLESQDRFDIEYLAPLGFTDPKFVKNYTLTGKNGDWFTPIDVPYNRTNSNSIMSYFLSFPTDSNIIAMGPFDKNTSLTGWTNMIAASTLYYTKIFRNKAINSEFAPVFDLTNGILDYTSPLYLLSTDERDALLNFKAPINSLVYNLRAKAYYMNDNRTFQTNIDLASEEQNRRMINKIKKDAKRLLSPFKGRINTITTRADVISVMKNYFSEEIDSQRYRPDEYEIVCDESNNTIDDINSNRLNLTIRVRFRGSIKFIDILVDAFPLGVDFTS